MNLWFHFEVPELLNGTIVNMYKKPYWLMRFKASFEMTSSHNRQLYYSGIFDV